jgi:8-oxo-dGTP diphosphatase
MPYSYEYPRPAIATDIILTAKIKQIPYLLLIQRKNPPFQHQWAFPGGFMNMDERLYETAVRELEEETGIALKELTFFGLYDKPDRDPRGRTIGIVYYAVLPQLINPNHGDDAENAKWFPLTELPPLAFDHSQIIQDFIRSILTQY